MVLMQTKSKFGIRENEAADRAAKEALDKKTKTTYSRSHALFGPKTFNCQVCISNLAERMGLNCFGI